LEVTPFDHSLKDEYLNEYYNMTVNFSKSSKDATLTYHDHRHLILKNCKKLI